MLTISTILIPKFQISYFDYIPVYDELYSIIVLVDTCSDATAPYQPIPMAYVYTPYIDDRGYAVAIHTAEKQALLHFDKDLNFKCTLKDAVMNSFQP